MAIVNREQAEAWDGDEGAHWAEHADRYDASVAAYDEPLLAAAAIAPTDAVLDVGCGCGAVTLAAAQRATQGRAHGVDLSTPMLRVAESRAAHAGATNATFARADAQVEAFGDGAFDVVVSRFGAMFFGDLGAAFVNLGRAVRPGGRLAVVAWTDLARNDWLREIRTTLAAGRDLPEPPIGAPGPFGLGDPERNRGWLTAAGFDSVEHQEHRLGFRFGADTEDACAFMGSTLPVRSLLAPLDDAARVAALARFRDLVERHAGPTGVELGSSAWVISAVKR
jgi:SAM-dependent methyltransferase